MREPESEQLSVADVAHKAAVAVLDLHAIEEAIGFDALRGFSNRHLLEYIVAFDTTGGKVTGAKVFFWLKDTLAEQSPAGRLAP